MNDFLLNVAQYPGILVGTLLSFAVFSGIMFYSMQRKIRIQQRDIQQLCKDVSALCKGAAGLDSHIMKVETRVRSLAENQEKLNMGSASGDIGKAVKMLERGSSIEEIIDICGLIDEEARLLMLVHGKGIKMTGTTESTVPA